MSSQIETENTRLKYFQRRPGRPRQDTKDLETSPNANIEPKEDAGGHSSLATAFQFADYVFSSGKASSESQALAMLIHRVRQDDTEASRLYLSPAVSNFLEAWPDKKSWIDSILTDMHRALNDIGSYMEIFRVAGDDGGAMGLKRKFEWISGHQKRLSTKQQLLLSCHQSLMTAINIMQTVELCGVTNGTSQDPIYEAPVQPWVQSEDANLMRGPYSRREYRISQKSISLSSMHLPQSEEDKAETRSVNSIPAELPGSTPEDLQNSNMLAKSTSAQFPSVQSPTQDQSFVANMHNDAATRFINKNRMLHPESLLPGVAQLKLQPMLDHDYTPYRTRVSLDRARPHSEHSSFGGSQTLITKRFTSTDLPRALPTLVEKALERNDSTTSTTAIVSVPQVAKRYEVNPIYIRRNPDRHKSLPSELPRLQNQSSLTEDLADWMMLPSAHGEKLGSTDWDASSVSQSSAVSVMSCPVVVQPSTYESQSIALSPEEIDTNGDALPLMQRSYFHDKERATSIRSARSSISRKPLPNSSISQIDLTDPTANYDDDAISRSPIPLEHDSGPPAGRPDTTSSSETLMITEPSTEATKSLVGVPENSQSVAMYSNHDAELSLLQQNLLRQDYVEIAKTPMGVGKRSNLDLDNAEKDADRPSSLAKACVPQGETSVSNTPKAVVAPKPMSAQAKRRAAHRRRMEIDFGPS